MHIPPFERDSIVQEAGCSQAAAEVQVYQSCISFVTKGRLDTREVASFSVFLRLHRQGSAT